MSQYQLTNSNRGKETIHILQSELEHLERREASQATLLCLKDNIDLIKECQLNNVNGQLNRALNQSKITIQKAILITLGLNPILALPLSNQDNYNIFPLLKQMLDPREVGIMSILIDEEVEAKIEGMLLAKEYINNAVDAGILEVCNGPSTVGKRTRRVETLRSQVLINRLARELMVKFKDRKLNKSTVARELISLPKIMELDLQEETLRREYLGKHPNY